MAAPLYFLPGLGRDDIAPGGRLNQQLLADRGLAHVFGDLRNGQLDCAMSEIRGRGPDGNRGTLVCALGAGKQPPARLGYYPELQTWSAGFLVGQAAAEPPFFLGIDNDDRPTPADVARPHTIAGYPVRLADGNEWQVPVIRRPNGTTELPQAMGWNAAGEFECTVKAVYRAAWEESGKTADLFYDEDSPNSDEFETLLLRCLQALGLNYRIGPPEQTALSLVDSGNWEEILGATVDVPLVRKAVAELKKKRQAEPTLPASPNSPPGNRAESETTDQAAANCI